MKSRFILPAGAVCACVMLSTAVNSRAVTMSIDPASASTVAIPAAPDAILSDPGGPGAAVVVVAGTGMANVDAFTYGEFGPVDDGVLFFSVSPASMGAAAAVALEAAGGLGGPGDHPADVYGSAGGGMNFLAFDGNGIANPLLAPNLGLIEPISAGPFDNIDGLDMRAPGPSIFWSVDPGTIAGFAPYAGTSAASIFISPTLPGFAGAPVLYAGALALGLAFADDIDALEVVEDGVAGFTPGDSILFSLAPGSPSLLPGGIFGPGGASAADLLGVGGAFGAAPTVIAPAVALGLLPSDNIDALDLIPEPGRAVLAMIGIAGVLLRRRR